MMINVAIVGATGYTGLELCRLLLDHPKVQIKHLYANSNSGSVFSDLYPQFKSKLDHTLEVFNATSPPSVDLLFLAVPHAQSHAYMHELYESPLRIIDLSADFRLDSSQNFEKYYNTTHQNPLLMKSIVYGIPELFSNDIKKAKCVANPGCYATSVILGLYPLFKEKLIEGTIIADSKSGASGAGRGAKVSTLFCEVSEGFSAYSTGAHRHEAEIEQILGSKVFFSPHLVPMNRGILSSLYIDLNKGLSTEQIIAMYQTYYKNCPFIILNKDRSPNTKYVSGSNNCMIHITQVKGKTVIFSVIDNLIKGAAGQAIQNMNLMYHYDESEGLPSIGHYL
ncbi:N-acetyl-gamma-glutamyl-phosphate reductase [Candidatus Marinamargulisbacteria bacterium SCGC AAA071-K20]|nr:N-acetyl-gamma-glutamyl-phosphate reductase [Candidatus Marinamargulisbacteria bacterium SCGC AAA071-K20]